MLFDADGVVQMPHAIRRDAWLHVLGHERDLDEFIGAVFEAERPALEGQADFVSALSDLMTDWACIGTIDDALAIWTMIEPDAAVVAVVKSLRRAGVHCSLATNQEPFRARFMSTTLGYSELFDQEFYSCRMGVSKPSVEYFRTILTELGVEPSRVLFIDDHQVNVAAARETGIQAVAFAPGTGAAALVEIVRSFGVDVV